MNTSPAPSESSPAQRQPHPSPHRARVAAWSTWFGLLGAPLAWGLQEAINVSLASYACYPHDVPLPAPMWPSLTVIAGGVEAIAIAICVAAGIVAFINWRRSRSEKPGDAHQLLASGDGRTRFMAMAGMLVSTLFLLAVAVAALNIAATPPCGG